MSVIYDKKCYKDQPNSQHFVPFCFISPSKDNGSEEEKQRIAQVLEVIQVKVEFGKISEGWCLNRPKGCLKESKDPIVPTNKAASVFFSFF